MFGFKAVRIAQKEQGISERKLAEKADVSRRTLRGVLLEEGNVTVKNIEKVSRALGREPFITLFPPPSSDVSSDDSIPVVSLLISQDEKWTIHLFNFVDTFRRTKDQRLVILPPVKQCPLKYRALLASTVCELCTELGLDLPLWANQTTFLPTPWFVSGSEALKAMALQESPLYFRRNNIFVLDNFLSRA